MLQKFSDLIKDTSLLNSNSALRRNAVIHAAWIEIKGIDRQIKENVRIRKIKDHTLYLVAHNGIWAQEVQLRNLEIAEKINRYIKSKTRYKITNVIVTVGNI